MRAGLAIRVQGMRALLLDEGSLICDELKVAPISRS